jgi:hypothetical protein
MRKLSGGLVVAAVLCSLMVVPPAWAVVGTVAVTVTEHGTERKPVPRARVRIGDQVALTDSQGRAELKVEEGPRLIEIAGPDHVSRQVPVMISPGTTTRAEVSVTPIFPFNVQNPGGVLGGWSIGALGLIQRDDLNMDREIEKIFINDKQVATFKNLSPNRFKSRVNAGGVEGVFGLPGFSIPSWEFQPAISLMGGGADVEIENTANKFRVSGPAWWAGGGIELAAIPASRPQLHLAVGYQGWYMQADDLESRSGNRSLCAAVLETSPGAQACRSSARMTSQTHEVYARAGYSLFNNHVGPFGGIKVRLSDINLRTDLRLDGPGAEVRQTLDIDFQRDTCPSVLGIAGVDLRGPGSLGNVFGRVQAEFNPASFSIMFKLMYAFGLMDR